MIVCPNCNHQNPEEATYCEACYTSLPSLTHCPNCHATVQSDASFCGQCGFNLQESEGKSTPTSPIISPTIAVSAPPSGEPPTVARPAFSTEESYVAPAPPTIATPPATFQSSSPEFDIPNLPTPDPILPSDPILSKSTPMTSTEANPSQPNFPEEEISGPHQKTMSPSVPASSYSTTPPPEYSPPTVAQAPASPSHTILQTQTAKLLHVQSNTSVEIPSNLTVIHIGKPNDRVPPDVDVSGFPNSEIVSRVHADIRVEGDLYYIEDVGSANGTYINNMPLPVGNRHRLRPGDRVALGKGDKVTFLFQIS
jgi:pSer/pThr/pTyr-binding forkhead associated (FHA) protein/ribosomal protein L40E